MEVIAGAEVMVIADPPAAADDSGYNSMRLGIAEEGEDAELEIEPLIYPQIAAPPAPQLSAITPLLPETPVAPADDGRGDGSGSADGAAYMPDAQEVANNALFAELEMQLAHALDDNEQLLIQIESIKKTYGVLKSPRRPLSIPTHHMRMDPSGDRPYYERGASSTFMQQAEALKHGFQPTTAFERLLQAKYQVAVFQQARYGKIDLRKIDEAIAAALPPGTFNMDSSQRASRIDIARRVSLQYRPGHAPAPLPMEMPIQRPPPTPDDGGIADAMRRMKARAVMQRLAKGFLARKAMDKTRVQRVKAAKEAAQSNPAWALEKPPAEDVPLLSDVQQLESLAASTAPSKSSTGINVFKQYVPIPSAHPTGNTLAARSGWSRPPKSKVLSPRLGVSQSLPSLPGLPNRPPPSPAFANLGQGGLALMDVVMDEHSPAQHSYLQHMGGPNQLPAPLPLPPPLGPPQLGAGFRKPGDAPLLQTPATLPRPLRHRRMGAGDALVSASTAPRRRQPWENSLTKAGDKAVAAEIAAAEELLGHSAATFAAPPNSPTLRPEHPLAGVVFQPSGPT